MSLKILCIVDHHDNITLVQPIFRMGFYDMIKARNGLQAISLAESQDIDIVLLDINLPDSETYEVDHG